MKSSKYTCGIIGFFFKWDSNIITLLSHGEVGQIEVTFWPQLYKWSTINAMHYNLKTISTELIKKKSYDFCLTHFSKGLKSVLHLNKSWNFMLTIVIKFCYNKSTNMLNLVLY